MLRVIALISVLASSAAAARATPFWVAYEGDDYPENEGWTRVFGDEHGPDQGGAVRSLADGIFTLDGLRNDQIVDFYERDRDLDPAPGELFVAEWRVLIEPRSDPLDAIVGIWRALSPGYAYFLLGPASVRIMPSGATIGIEEGVFHSYYFESADMRTFSLRIDDAITFDGNFYDNTTLQYSVAFGDSTQGERSLSQWDFFRYGILPEPTSAWGLLCLLASSVPRQALRRHVVGSPASP
jgi:hypothetical protein